MGFGGPPVITSAGRNSDRITAATLAARAGVPAVAAADTGELTTAAPAANQQGLTQNLGPGRGNWVAADVDRVIATVHDINNAAQGMAGQTSHVDVSAITIAAGDLTVQFHNNGAQASGALIIWVEYVHSLAR